MDFEKDNSKSNKWEYSVQLGNVEFVTSSIIDIDLLDYIKKEHDKLNGKTKVAK